MGNMLEISGRTQLLAIIGDPIAQVRAPLMMNEELERTARHDAVMVPLHVESKELSSAIEGIRAVKNFKGAIITMPHKVAVLPLLDELSPQAMEVNAVNVIRRDASGRLVGTNLDGEGFVAGLESAGHHISGKRFYLFGAGGAASAIAFALARHGGEELVVTNRSSEKAARLVERVKAAFPKAHVAANCPLRGDEDVVINATPLGMRPADALPFDPTQLSTSTVVADAVIEPEITPLLAAAQRHGCTVHTGRPMLREQISTIIQYTLGF